MATAADAGVSCILFALTLSTLMDSDSEVAVGQPRRLGGIRRTKHGTEDGLSLARATSRAPDYICGSVDRFETPALCH